jgi:hypothetical protein
VAAGTATRTRAIRARRAPGDTTALLGDDLTNSWRLAFTATPRELLFIPDRALWVRGGEVTILIDRNTDPDTGMAAVYSGDFIITHLDDGATGGEGDYTSSSMPSIMLAMLTALDAHKVQKSIGDGDPRAAMGLAGRPSQHSHHADLSPPAAPDWRPEMEPDTPSPITNSPSRSSSAAVRLVKDSKAGRDVVSPSNPLMGHPCTHPCLPDRSSRSYCDRGTAGGSPRRSRSRAGGRSRW